VTLQCWDNDVLSDDFLGKIELNLSNMIKGSRTPDRCNIKMIRNKGKKANRRPCINLFKTRHIRGWWPFHDDSNSVSKLTGKVEAEFMLLNESQALENPVGLGRSEPEALPEPK
jgi:hypothetical protein